MPLGTETDLGPRHIVLEGVPALRKRGTGAPIFSTEKMGAAVPLSRRAENNCLIKHVIF